MNSTKTFHESTQSNCWYIKLTIHVSITRSCPSGSTHSNQRKDIRQKKE